MPHAGLIACYGKASAGGRSFSATGELRKGETGRALTDGPQQDAVFGTAAP